MNLISAIVRNQNSPIIRGSIQTRARYIVGGDVAPEDSPPRGFPAAAHNKYRISRFNRPIIKRVRVPGNEAANPPTRSAFNGRSGEGGPEDGHRGWGSAGSFSGRVFPRASRLIDISSARGPPRQETRIDQLAAIITFPRDIRPATRLTSGRLQAERDHSSDSARPSRFTSRSCAFVVGGIEFTFRLLQFRDGRESVTAIPRLCVPLRRPTPASSGHLRWTRVRKRVPEGERERESVLKPHA